MKVEPLRFRIFLICLSHVNSHHIFTYFYLSFCLKLASLTSFSEDTNRVHDGIILISIYSLCSALWRVKDDPLFSCTELESFNYLIFVHLKKNKSTVILLLLCKYYMYRNQCAFINILAIYFSAFALLMKTPDKLIMS